MSDTSFSTCQMRSRRFAAAALLLVAATAWAEPSSAQDGVKALLDRAQQSHDKKAVEDLIGRLEGKPKGAPQAPPSQAPAATAPATPAAPAVAAPASPPPPSVASPVVVEPVAPKLQQPEPPPVVAAPTPPEPPTAKPVEAAKEASPLVVPAAPKELETPPPVTVVIPQHAVPPPAPLNVPPPPPAIAAPSAPPAERPAEKASTEPVPAPARPAETAAPQQPPSPPPQAAIQPPPAPIAPKTGEAAAARADREQLPNVNLELPFAYNSAEILPEAIPTLRLLGQALTDARLAKATFLIAGHTDAKGAADYNRRLSQQRAEAVRAFLVAAYGIEEARLTAQGFGSSRLKNPRKPTADENRRVQIINVTQ